MMKTTDQPHRVTAPPPAEILAAVQRGQKYGELAAIYGVSESTLRRRVQESDLVVRRRHGVLPAPPVRNEEPTWMAEGLCFETDPEAFFPEIGGSSADAKRICGRCPARDACLSYALENDERFGVWGNTTPSERKQMRRAAKPATTTTRSKP